MDPTPTSPETPRTYGEQVREEIDLVWTELTRFYGLTFDDLRRMPRVFRRIYYDAMPRIGANEQMQAIQAASFANLKESDQRKIMKRLERKAAVGGVLAEAEAAREVPAAEVANRQAASPFPMKTPSGETVDPRKLIRSKKEAEVKDA